MLSLAIVTLESQSEMLFQKLQRRQQNSNQKVKERQVFLALQEFISHQSLSSFGLSTVEIKLKLIRSQQSGPFVFRQTLAFCERFKYDMKINAEGL